MDDARDARLMAATVTGRARHSARLRQIALRANQAVLRALYAAGQEIEAFAEHSITDGSVSGAGHVPSRPGEPPNADTRLLDTSIETTIASPSPPTVHVTSNAPYSAALEYGTSKMAERPFMRPALRKKRKRVRQIVEAAVAKTAR